MVLQPVIATLPEPNRTKQYASCEAFIDFHSDNKKFDSEGSYQKRRGILRRKHKVTGAIIKYKTHQVVSGRLMRQKGLNDPYHTRHETVVIQHAPGTGKTYVGGPIAIATTYMLKPDVESYKCIQIVPKSAVAHCISTITNTLTFEGEEILCAYKQTDLTTEAIEKAKVIITTPNALFSAFRKFAWRDPHAIVIQNSSGNGFRFRQGFVRGIAPNETSHAQCVKILSRFPNLEAIIGDVKAMAEAQIKEKANPQQKLSADLRAQLMAQQNPSVVEQEDEQDADEDEVDEEDDDEDDKPQNPNAINNDDGAINIETGAVDLSEDVNRSAMATKEMLISKLKSKPKRIPNVQYDPPNWEELLALAQDIVDGESKTASESQKKKLQEIRSKVRKLTEHNKRDCEILDFLFQGTLPEIHPFYKFLGKGKPEEDVCKWSKGVGRILLTPDGATWRSSQPFDLVVVDEGQKLNKPKNGQHHCVSLITACSHFGVCMTGTAVKNRFDELAGLSNLMQVSQLYFRERRFWRQAGRLNEKTIRRATIQDFHQAYIDEIIKESHIELPETRLHHVTFEPFVGRNIDGSYNLDVINEHETCNYNCRRHSEMLLEYVQTGVENPDFKDAKKNLWSSVTTCNNLDFCPVLGLHGADAFKKRTQLYHDCLQNPSQAQQLMYRYIRDRQIHGHPRISVHCESVEMLQILLNYCEQRGGCGGLYLFSGKLSYTKRPQMVEDFLKSKRGVIFLSPAGGEAITLCPGCEVQISFGCFGWSPQDLVQARDRIHRVGQNEPVEYIELVARGSVGAARLASHADKRDRLTPALCKRDFSKFKAGIGEESKWKLDAVQAMRYAPIDDLGNYELTLEQREKVDDWQVQCDQAHISIPQQPEPDFPIDCIIPGPFANLAYKEPLVPCAFPVKERFEDSRLPLNVYDDPDDTTSSKNLGKRKRKAPPKQTKRPAKRQAKSKAKHVSSDESDSDSEYSVVSERSQTTAHSAASSSSTPLEVEESDEPVVSLQDRLNAFKKANGVLV